MSPRAQVHSVDSVRGFRPAMYQFESELSGALAAIRQEVGRALQWLDHDCPAYWQTQVRLGFDRVASARTELARKQMMTVAGHRPECIDEKKALRDAKQRLEQAQEKVRLAREWGIKVHRAADEHQSRLTNVEQKLAYEVPKLIAMLDRIIAALESYVMSNRSSGVETANSPAAVEVEIPSELSAAPADDQTVPSADVPATDAGGKTPVDADA